MPAEGVLIKEMPFFKDTFVHTWLEPCVVSILCQFVHMHRFCDPFFPQKVWGFTMVYNVVL